MGLRRTHLLALAVAALSLAASTDAHAQILSSKRGFSDTGAGYTYLQATGAGWYYTWGPGAANPGGFDAKFIPMIWSGTPSSGTLNAIKNNAAIEYVLGFNEPERDDQANMTVAQAISSWTTISNSLGATKKLISPAVADTGEGQAWLSSFMSQASSAGLKVDAVAFHWYGVSNPSNPAGAASSFLSRVDSYHNSYGKPVFITEFAIHDWGGAYSDADIIEANREFLDIVVPALESRSYVTGYSFYPWFSDGPMWTGNPVRPTEMAYTYVGALKPGYSEDLAGKSYGEHVAYMIGGDVTLGSAATVSLKYISALEKTSTVSGSVDWALAGSGSRVRIESGAKLRKTGTNQITFGSAAVTNNGGLEVSQGKLVLGSSVAGTGNAIVRGGTLALGSAGRLNTASLVDVKGGGTLDVSAMSITYPVSSGRTLNVDRNGQLIGNVLAGTGSTVSGGGTFNGNLSAGSGALVRIGKDGAGVASRFVVDNFESYALGDVRDVASPPWTAHQNTSLAEIESVSGSKVFSFGFATGARGASRELPDAAVIDNAETATFFFRINSKTADPDHNVGLTDSARTGEANFGDFEAQLRLKANATANTFDVDARNGGAFSATLKTGLALNSWYNVWMVVNQATDKYDLYMNTGTANATAGDKLNATPLSFRNGTTGDLNAFLALSNLAPVDNGVRVDDITFLTGSDLSNPTAGLNPGLIWTAETLTVAGNYTQTGGSTLEMNIFSPAVHDTLAVTGTASLGGTLNVTLALDAAQPQFGDVFDILDFGSAAGSFAAVNLPTLGTGLTWSTSDLLTTGAIEVIYVPGDFDHNGLVDGSDLMAWQRGESPEPFSAADLAAWQGALASAATGAAGAVPEPTSLALLLSAAAMAVASRGRRRLA